VKSFMKYYTGTSNICFYLFTDTDPCPYAPNINIKYFHNSHTNWRDGTNSKFTNMISLENEDVDHLYYFDADTSISSPFSEAWFLGDLVGGEHYGNSFHMVTEGRPYDRNPESAAYIPIDTQLPQMYYYGAFFGGKKQAVVDLCKVLHSYQQQDSKIPYEPIFNDESYLNKHFHYNPPGMVVPTAKFGFNVSCKGGLGDTRNMLLNIDTYKADIIARPTEPFVIVNQKIVFV